MKPNVKNITLLDPPYHISEFLTHWTGRDKIDSEAFDILCKIVNSQELKFSPCPISPPTSLATVKNEMICFTDTPIPQSLKHCEKYNYFGISFNKNEMMEYGANPVLYLVKSRYEHQEFHTALSFRKPFKLNRNKNLFSWIGSIFQPYDKGHSDYYEREWRIVRILPYSYIPVEIKRAGSFNEYPYKGKLRRVDTGRVPNGENFYMSFASNIIENIIVPKDYEKQAIKLLEKNNLSCELIILSK